MIPCTLTFTPVNHDQIAQDVIEETIAEQNTSSCATSASSSSADPISNHEKSSGSIFEAIAKIFNDGLELIKSIFLYFFPSLGVENKDPLDIIMADEPHYVNQVRAVE